ncbi:MAG: hypothetical protein QOE18_1571, partial [Chloroflexota bacterium]|nr:hypothetical protein [Chloroflexota bacterium]
MPLHDLAQSLPGVVAAAVLPGFALATLLAPHWRAWQRLAMAPGLSAGFIGVVGMAMHDAHIPFEPLTILPLLALLGVAAVFRWRRAEGEPAAAPPWWLPIPALVAGLVGAGVFVWALHGQVLPPDWDTATHGGLVNTIARQHDVLPLIPIPIEASDLVRLRPGFEAMTAVVSWRGAPSPAMSMGPVVAVTLILIPLSLTLLTLEATGSIALAALVPVFALGLAFPSDQTIVGRFPEIVDSTLIVPFIVVTLRILHGRNTRDNALLLFAITASIWVIHGLEVFTALVVGCALLVWTAVRVVRAAPRDALLRIGAAVGAVLVGAALVTLLTRTPHVRTPIATQPSAIVLPVGSSPVMLHQIVGDIAQTDLISPVTLGLFAIGVVALLVRRRMLWIFVAEAVLLVLMVDDFYLHKLNRLWRLIYPWGDTDRILGVQYWLIPLVLGVGLLALADVMRALSRTRRLVVAVSIAALVVVIAALVARHPLGHLWTSLIGGFTIYLYPLGVFAGLSALRPWILTVSIAALALIVAWVALARRTSLPGFMHDRLGPVARNLDVAGAALGLVAVLCVVVGAASELAVYQTAVETRSLVTPADLTVMHTMSATLPMGTVVITDGGDDAGMWLTALTDLTPLVPNGFEFGTLSIPLDVALADACVDPAFAVRAIQQVKADARFVGSQRNPAAEYKWDVTCIARLPHLRLITSVPGDG